MSLRVMTYNVRYFANLARVAGTRSTRTGVQAIAGAIADLEQLPHVVGLQEVEARSLRSAGAHFKGNRDELQIDVVMEELSRALTERDRPETYIAHYFPAHVYGVRNARLYTTGLAFLVRDDVGISEPRHFDITHRSKFVTRHLKQSRICAHLEVTGPSGLTCDVFNTHLSLPELAKNFYRIPSRMGYGANQLKEVNAVARFIADHKNSDRYLIMGDFNTLPASPAYELIQEVMHVHDPFPDLLDLSVDDLRADYPTAGFMRFRMRLDHIFAGPGLRWLDYEDTHPFGRVDGQWHGLSDHVPIIGRFESR